MIDKTMIKLVLADDQTLVRGALAALLSICLLYTSALPTICSV